jgi:multisubunit Na+/H+ antiporter MnhB subunit
MSSPRQAQRDSRPRKTKTASSPKAVKSAPSRGSSIHRNATRGMSVVMIVIGIALLARTLAAGGGGLATGVLLGVLFILAGAGRLYLQSRS